METYENASVEETETHTEVVSISGRNAYEKPLPDPPNCERDEKTESLYFVPDAIYARPHQLDNNFHDYPTEKKKKNNFMKTLCKRKINIIIVVLTVLVILALIMSIVCLALFSQIKNRNANNSDDNKTLSTLNKLQRRLRILEKDTKNQLLTTLQIYDWYKAGNGFWYKVFHNKVKYITARENCKVLGTRLASVGIRSPKTKRELFEELSESSTRHMWIGLDNLEQTSKNWTWSDGTLSTTNNTRWKTGYPDEESESRKCGYILDVKNWPLNARDCGRSFEYLCETLHPL